VRRRELAQRKRILQAFRSTARADAAVPGRCIFLRRPEARANHGAGKLAHRDFRAIELVEKLLLYSGDAIQGIEESATQSSQFQELLTNNCVVVGSPMVNPASELAICHAFGVPAFDPSQATNLPFAFRVVGSDPRASAVILPSDSRKQGIWLSAEKQLIEADYWPPEEFKRRRIGRGRDCGLVVVMSHRHTEQSEETRKLVVLAGFSGVATECAARALVDHFRDLEPRDRPDYVWGVIEVSYYKPANSTSREILNYTWRRRVGGRCPVALSKRKR
jgi:hypothetical protein